MSSVKTNFRKGFTLIEVLIAIAMVGGVIAVFGVLLNVLRINKSGSFAAAAYKIAQEEIDIVKSYPLSSLTARTSSTFIGTIDNAGSFGAMTTSTAISSPNALANNAASSSPLGIITLPYANLADFAFESSVKKTDISGKTGLLFRAKDLDNYYFLYLQNNQLVLDKRFNGVTSTLYSTAQTFLPDTWYKLKIAAAGSNLSLYIDDNLRSTVTDASLALGAAALANQGNTAHFDNASLIHDSITENWNFDNLTPGSLPANWTRLGINDLPNGAGALTISEPYGAATIKKIDVTVSWTERGQNKLITLSTLKTE